MRRSKRHAVRSYLEQLDVPGLINSVPSYEEKTSLLELIVKTGLDFILPLRSRTVLSNEPPWFTSRLKDLIKRRQMALVCGNLQDFKRLRNRVNRERKVCRAKYYFVFRAKVHHLKDCKPSDWWKEVKKLSGITSVYSSKDEVYRSLENLDKASNVTTGELAHIINEAFLSPMRSFSPLPEDILNRTNTICAEPAFTLTVTTQSVLMKLSKLNPTKANGPDGIPG